MGIEFHKDTCYAADIHFDNMGRTVVNLCKKIQELKSKKLEISSDGADSEHICELIDNLKNTEITNVTLRCNNELLSEDDDASIAEEILGNKNILSFNIIGADTPQTENACDMNRQETLKLIHSIYSRETNSLSLPNEGERTKFAERKPALLTMLDKVKLDDKNEALEMLDLICDTSKAYPKGESPKRAPSNEIAIKI